MANERLYDATPEEIAAATLADPQARLIVGSQDPRAQLMEMLYGDPAAKKAIQAHTKRLRPGASIPEVDLPAQIREELKDDLSAIKDLRGRLEGRELKERHTEFRDQLVAAGADAADLDKIETFMVDNEFGTTPAARRKAVEAYYEAQELAEPRAGLEHAWELPDAEGPQMKALLNAEPGADLDAINMPFAEKIFRDLTGGTASRGRRMVGA